MNLPLFIVDAFSSRPFGGNPAAVCILGEPRPDEWLQRVAGEMNLSETAFLIRQDDGYSLRWFTPEVEVDLCGHATLASAHALWGSGEEPKDRTIRFQTRSGLLIAERQGDWIELDFPALKTKPVTEAPAGLAESLGVPLRFVGSYGMDYLCEVESEEVLRGLAPDFARLRSIRTRGVIATSLAGAGGAGYDFVSRFFAPGVGIAEDPVTGSAHCALGPFWAERLGKAEFLAYQASKRGGLVRVRVEGDRVKLGGQAVTVVRGELLG
ncbi:PhzF family phenazine biosynthesis protein [Singulisphaera sp. PoT]|uniref:PhzF family phenazine biosynthesis protein n=1 Tax=Singulisphaera sp. PoT TaxID=3411797 RepID=UPI003BF4E679